VESATRGVVMITEEIKKYLSSLSKKELLELCLQLIEEQLQAAAKICTKLSEMK
jgi:hypothetical protein